MSIFKFRPPYSVSGEEGHALSAKRVPLEMIDAQSATLRFASQEADVMSWTKLGGIPIDPGQQITLWDADGKRVFTGKVKVLNDDWTPARTIETIEVHGPWDYYESVKLSGELADADVERPSFSFPSQDIAKTLKTIIDRMEAIGVPITLGELPQTFPFIAMVINNSTAAQVLASILEVIPDAGTRVRYDTPGLPEIDITRRASAEITVLQLGSGNDDTQRISLRPRIDLRPDAVAVQSVSVDSEGNFVYNEETAENGIAGIIGKQLLAVSGPGQENWRKPEISKVQLQTMPISSTSLDLFYRFHPGLAALQKVLQDAGVGTPRQWTILNGTATITVPTGSGYNVTTYAPRQAWQINGVASATGAGAFSNALIAGDLPEWWSETGIATQQIKITRRFTASAGNSDPWQGEIAALADYSNAVSGGAFYYADLEIELTAINATYTALTTILRPSDLIYLTPPPGLAANLLEAQNFIPYEGSANLGPDAPAIPLPAGVLCVRNGPKEDWSTAKAMIAATEIDLRTGASIIKIGTPARSSIQSLADRFRRSVTGKIVDL
jgi:hypothetical protein